MHFSITEYYYIQHTIFHYRFNRTMKVYGKVTNVYD